MFSDSHILLADAKDLLEVIENAHSRDIVNGADSPFLRVRVKQYLDAINASLDYAAYKIFTDYCLVHDPSKYAKLGQFVFFPIYPNRTDFIRKVSSMFPTLMEMRPDIVAVFEKYQPFPARSQWPWYLKQLCINNKHRYLSQQIKQTATHIDNLELPGGGGFRNLTLITKGDTAPVAYGDSPLNLENPNELPKGVQFAGSVEKGFYFREIDQPVLNTLQRIYRSAPTVIDDLEKIL